MVMEMLFRKLLKSFNISNKLFYIVPALNQGLGIVITVFVIAKMNAESAGELAIIASTAALLLPLFTLRIDILLAHENNIVSVKQFNDILNILHSITICIFIFVLILAFLLDYKILQNNFFIASIGAFVMSGYALQYANFVQKSDRESIVNARTINLILGIITLPLVIIKISPLSVFALQIARNNTSFFILSIYNSIKNLRETSYLDKIFNLKKHWYRLMQIWLDYIFNQATTHIIILYTSLINKEVGGTFFIIYSAINSLNAIYSRTIGLDFVLLAGKNKSQALKKFLKSQVARVFVVCSVVSLFTVLLFRLSLLDLAWPDLDKMLIMCTPLAILILIVSSASQYYLMNNEIGKMLKINIFAGSVKVITFIGIVQWGISIALAMCIAMIMFYLIHFIFLFVKIAYD